MCVLAALISVRENTDVWGWFLVLGFDCVSASNSLNSKKPRPDFECHSFEVHAPYNTLSQESCLCSAKHQISSHRGYFFFSMSISHELCGIQKKCSTRSSINKRHRNASVTVLVTHCVEKPRIGQWMAVFARRQRSTLSCIIMSVCDLRRGTAERAFVISLASSHSYWKYPS